MADFGLASIVDSKNEVIYNVGTPMYKSPELLENHTIYDIKDTITLKSCDVFSLSIIFWQMMNGIEYLPFKLYTKPININTTNYKYIKHGQSSGFWQIHQHSNLMKINNNNYYNNKNSDVDLLLNLFEQMFNYNPCQRISIEKMFKHEWIIQHMDDASFHMNESALEAYVRALYHQTKDNNKKKQSISFHNGVKKQIEQNTPQNTTSERSTSGSMGVKLFAAEMNHLDSSKIAQRNASQTYILKNKKYDTFNPLELWLVLKNMSIYRIKKVLLMITSMLKQC